MREGFSAADLALRNPTFAFAGFWFALFRDFPAGHLPESVRAQRDAVCSNFGIIIEGFEEFPRPAGRLVSKLSLIYSSKF